MAMAKARGSQSDRSTYANTASPKQESSHPSARTDREDVERVAKRPLEVERPAAATAAAPPVPLPRPALPLKDPLLAHPIPMVRVVAAPKPTEPTAPRRRHLAGPVVLLPAPRVPQHFVGLRHLRKLLRGALLVLGVLVCLCMCMCMCVCECRGWLVCRPCPRVRLFHPWLSPGWYWRASFLYVFLISAAAAVSSRPSTL
jgi:hypothetical protein